MERDMRDFDKIREDYEFQLEGRQLKTFVMIASAICLLVFVLGFLVGRHFPRQVPGQDLASHLIMSQEQSGKDGNSEKTSPGFNFEFFEELSEDSKEVKPQLEPALPEVPGISLGEQAETKPDVPAAEEELSEQVISLPSPIPGAPEIASTAVPKLKTTVIPTLYTIQVGAFEDPDSAEDLSAQLKRKGFLSYTQIKDVPGKGVWYRVRIGQFETRDEAERNSRALEEREGLSTFITLYSK